MSLEPVRPPRQSRGRALRLAVALSVALSGLAIVGPAPVSVLAAPAPGGSSSYVPVTPVRLADTRPAQGAYGFTNVNANIIRVKVRGTAGVPDDAVAAVVNVTMIRAAGVGFITVFPPG